MRKAMGRGEAGAHASVPRRGHWHDVLALLLGLVLVEMMFPAFTAFAGKDISLVWLRNGWVLLAIVVAVTVTGLTAGSYPAFYLSALEPGKVLRGDLTRGGPA